MKRTRLIPFALAFALLLSGCGKPTPSSSVSESETTSETTSETSSGSESTSEDELSSLETSSEDGGQLGVIPTTVNLYYHRDDGDYTNNGIWYWRDGLDGKYYDVTVEDDQFALLTIDNTPYPDQMGFYIIARKKTSWDGQSPDFYVDFKLFPTNSEGVMDLYFIQTETRDIEMYSTRKDALGDRVVSADFTTFKTVKATGTAVATSWSLVKNDELVEEKSGTSETVTFTLTDNALLTDRYEVRVVFPSAPEKIRYRKVSAYPIFNSAEFVSNYTYNGDDLGAIYTPESTTFKLWAPTAYSVSLSIFKVGYTSKETGNVLHDYPTKRHPMTYAGQGVYTATVSGDLNKNYYTYTVENAAGIVEVTDPYAYSSGPNSRRSQVLDFSKYESPTFDSLTFAPITSTTDLTVYEIHVQDLTTDPTWTGTEENRGKYKGLIESGTTYTKDGVTVSTGFDHIKEMGVNAVQIMPFYDQANDEYDSVYNWGYNPAQYNVLEGMYSSNPVFGEVRVQEFKDVVEKFANHGMRIVMDVVYNHMASFSASSFQKIVPDYFFRRHADGTLKNESGVGNDIATERVMMSKFIVDSCYFWAKEYNIKGFRFDLMSLIDDTTLKNVEQKLQTLDPQIVVWGEPWSGGGYVGPAKVYQNGMDATRIAAFNDVGRNAMKGDNNLNGNGNQYGWLQKEPQHNQESYNLINNVKGMMAGKMHDYYSSGTYTNPTKTVNYAGVHDNFTLYDHLLATTGHVPALAKKASLVANALVLTAQGTPFFQGGDEMMRTKVYDPTTKIGAAFLETHGNESYTHNGVYYSGNSYNLEASVNTYRWADKVDNLAYFEAYKALIQLRKDYKGFRANDASTVASKVEFWNSTQDAPISYSAIGITNRVDTPLFAFYTGRLYGDSTPGSHALSEQLFKWNVGTLKVLFDSEGLLTGQILSNHVALGSYRVIIGEYIG